MIPSSPIVPRQTVNSNSVAAQQMFWVLSFRQKPCPCRNNRRAWHTWKLFDETSLLSFISANIQIRKENVEHLSRLFLKDHSCFLDLYPIGFTGKGKLVGRWQHFDLLATLVWAVRWSWHSPRWTESRCRPGSEREGSKCSSLWCLWATKICCLFVHHCQWRIAKARSIQSKYLCHSTTVLCHSSSSTQALSGRDTAISFKAKVASHNFWSAAGLTMSVGGAWAKIAQTATITKISTDYEEKVN